MMSDELNAFFGKKELNRKQIADILGSNPTMVSNLINGHVKFGKTTAYKWQNAFGLNAIWLMTGQGDMMLNEDKPPQISIRDSKVAGRDIKESNADLLQIVKSQQETIASQQADLHSLIEKLLKDE